jgi:hypothetical protein
MAATAEDGAKAAAVSGTHVAQVPVDARSLGSVLASPPPRGVTAHAAKPPHLSRGGSASMRRVQVVQQYPSSALDVLEPVYGCVRSGAFAVHGREPRSVGLSRLVTAYASCHALTLPAQVWTGTSGAVQSSTVSVVVS